jgi:tRNA(fMet)-specific endonuclease VapC
MKYLLDTDTCSYIIKTPDLMRKRFEQVHAGDIAISSITWAELNSWVMSSSKPEQRMMSLQKMFAPIMILPFTAEDAAFHGPIRKDLKDQGKMIGALDLLIAAHALSRRLIVVTNNTEHFHRIDKLQIENWAKA